MTRIPSTPLGPTPLNANGRDRLQLPVLAACWLRTISSFRRRLSLTFRSVFQRRKHFTPSASTSDWWPWAMITKSSAGRCYHAVYTSNDLANRPRVDPRDPAGSLCSNSHGSGVTTSFTSPRSHRIDHGGDRHRFVQWKILWPRSLGPLIGLLGPICVIGQSGPVLVRGPKQQMLLALLAVAPGRTVSTDLLIESLWADRPPPSAVTAMRAHIARLRESLATASPRPEVVHRSPGYALVILPDRIDSVLFSALLNVTGEADSREALKRLDAALRLWRGDPYGGLSENELLQIEARRLRELYDTALEVAPP